MARWDYVVLFFLLWLPYVYVQPDMRDANALSRLDLLHAVVSQRTVCIDTYHRITPDKAVFQGHYYSDKAPGTVALALPAFFIASGALWLGGIDLESERGWRLSYWFTTAFSIAIITALGGLAFFAWIRRWVPPEIALLSTLALFLGSLPLPYATALFSQAAVVGLLCMCLWLLPFGPQCSGNPGGAAGAEGGGDRSIAPHQPSGARTFLAGLACGLAVASEYSAGVVALGIAILSLSLGWRHALLFCAGSLPALLLIPGYSWLCFGTPLALGYDYQATYPQMHHGLCGISFPPDVSVAIQLLFSPRHGLFFWTPFLLLAFLGLHRLFAATPALFWLAYYAPLLQTVFLAGFFDPTGGSTLSSRYFAPTLPLFMLPAALAATHWPRSALGLAGLSVGFTLLATLTDIHVPPVGPLPLVQHHLHRLLAGACRPNLWQALLGGGGWSPLPLAAALAGFSSLLWFKLRR